MPGRRLAVESARRCRFTPFFHRAHLKRRFGKHVEEVVSTLIEPVNVGPRQFQIGGATFLRVGEKVVRRRSRVFKELAQRSLKTDCFLDTRYFGLDSVDLGKTIGVDLVGGQVSKRCMDLNTIVIEFIALRQAPHAAIAVRELLRFPYFFQKASIARGERSAQRFLR